MDHEHMIKLLIDVKEQVDQMHGVVYRNGLVASVKGQYGEIKAVNDKLTKFLLARDETCPYRNEVKTRMKQRRETFDKRLLIYGAIIGGITLIPDIVLLLVEII